MASRRKPRSGEREGARKSGGNRNNEQLGHGSGEARAKRQTHKLDSAEDVEQFLANLDAHNERVAAHHDALQHVLPKVEAFQAETERLRAEVPDPLEPAHLAAALRIIASIEAIDRQAEKQLDDFRDAWPSSWPEGPPVRIEGFGFFGPETAAAVERDVRCAGLGSAIDGLWHAVQEGTRTISPAHAAGLIAPQKKRHRFADAIGCSMHDAVLQGGRLALAGFLAVRRSGNVPARPLIDDPDEQASSMALFRQRPHWRGIWTYACTEFRRSLQRDDLEAVRAELRREAGAEGLRTAAAASAEPGSEAASPAESPETRDAAAIWSLLTNPAREVWTAHAKLASLATHADLVQLARGSASVSARDRAARDELLENGVIEHISLRDGYRLLIQPPQQQPTDPS